LRENEPQGGTLMDKSRKKYNNLSIEEQKIKKELEGYQPDLLDGD